jgi:hypothetical protein
MLFLSGSYSDEPTMRQISKNQWKNLPLNKCLLFILVMQAAVFKNFNLAAQELPLIPLQSELLQKKVDLLKRWSNQAELASKLPYFSAQSQLLALDQYLMNAKVFMLKVATKALIYPILKLELNQELFQSNFFEFTKKYCEVDPRNNFDWAALSRQLFLLAKDSGKNLRWDDTWSKGNFPLEMQQKLYTARITKSLDAIKALCTREDGSTDSLAKYFLKDNVISLYFTEFMQDSESAKFFCDATLSCRQIPHLEFVEKLPRSLLDLEFKQEMINLWKTSIEDFSPNWDIIRKKYNSISSVSTQFARIQLRDELIGVSDFFSLTSILTKDVKSIHDDPILKSIKPFIDQIVLHKLNLVASKVTWEEPMEITIEKPVIDSQNSNISMDVKAVRGGFDRMIDKEEKFKLSDQIVFDRGFMEWFLRATLNIRYYNEQLYWRNVEAIQHHLLKRFENYIGKRKLTLPYLNYDKNMALNMTNWFIENRNTIAELVTKNPDQKVFPLLINHYLGLSALETRNIGE